MSLKKKVNLSQNLNSNSHRTYELHSKDFMTQHKFRIPADLAGLDQYFKKTAEHDPWAIWLQAASKKKDSPTGFESFFFDENEEM